MIHHREMTHGQRIKLANHLMTQGKSDNDVLKRFSHFSDFDRRIAKTHIASIRRMRRGY